MKAAGTAILLCIALAIGACGGDGDTSPNRPQAAGDAKEASAEEAKASKPKVEVPKGPPPKKLVKQDLEVGSGPAAKTGDEVAVHYVLVEHKNGKEIEASWDRGEPFTFQLGSGSVIPGWEQGVVGMKAGGRRELVIPSDLAYGSGALVFVIDLISIGEAPVREQPTSDEEAETPKPEIEVPDEPPPTEVIVEDIEEGTGAEVKKGDRIVVNYVGVSYETGKEFEAVWPPEEPTTFGVGTGELIKGWEQGIKGMKVGGRRELIIPSKLAFERGPVIYVVDLVDVR